MFITLTPVGRIFILPKTLLIGELKFFGISLGYNLFQVWHSSYFKINDNLVKIRLGQGPYSQTILRLFLKIFLTFKHQYLIES